MPGAKWASRTGLISTLGLLLVAAPEAAATSHCSAEGGSPVQSTTIVGGRDLVQVTTEVGDRDQAAVTTEAGGRNGAQVTTDIGGRDLVQVSVVILGPDGPSWAIPTPKDGGAKNNDPEPIPLPGTKVGNGCSCILAAVKPGRDGRTHLKIVANADAECIRDLTSPPPRGPNGDDDRAPR